jgi:hypothetical protein
MSTYEKITKSDFLRYLDAPLHLWAAKHNHIETPLSPFNTHLMNEGYQAEKLAREYIRTKLLNTLNGEIFHWQKTFSFENYNIRADALIEKPDTSTFDLYEIKSGTSVKPENILDAAFQYLILKKQLNIERVFILHLNKEYVRKGAQNIGLLFTAEDITLTVLEKIAEVEVLLPIILKTGSSSTKNAIPGCLNPKTCPCPSLCHPNLPENSIFDIPRLSAKKKRDLIAQGILSIQDIPVDFQLSEKQLQIVDVVSSNMEHIDNAAIKTEFQNFVYPLYFLDYETCLKAVPQFDGYHPQQQMVFQYSLHKMDAPDDTLIHNDFLADTNTNPSTDLVRKLHDDIGDCGTIFVWNKSFELTRHKELAVIHPEYAPFFADLNDRVYDLGDFVSKGLYLHPGFKGSWSIKNVLPVMVTDLSYEHLKVNKGDQAMVVWWKMVNSDLSTAEKGSIKNSLLEYCKLDTMAMVRIWEKLQEMC